MGQIKNIKLHIVTDIKDTTNEYDELKMFESMDWLLAVGCGSCALGGLIVYTCNNSELFLNVLKNVEELNIDEDLRLKLEENGGHLPYVSVKGQISADGNLLRSQSNESFEGVIRKTEIREHKASWNATFENWSHQDRSIAPPKWDQEPFSLIGSGDSPSEPRIHVEDPTSCYNTLELTTTYDHFQTATSGFGDALGALIKGEYTKGYRTFEQMLLINTTRTVIGELVQTNEEKFVIKSPRDTSLRYYITSGGVQTVVAEEIASIRAYRIFSFLLFVIGGGLCVYWAYKRYKKYTGERHDREEVDRLQREMKEFDENVEDVRVCTICVSRPRDVVFLPCGHVCSCVQCANQLDTCPVCRRQVHSRSAIFFS